MTRESHIAEISISEDGCRYHFSLSTHRLTVSEYLIQKGRLGFGSPREIPTGYCAFPLRAISEVAFHIDKEYSGCHLDVVAGSERKEWHVASKDRALIVGLMDFAETLSSAASGVPHAIDEDEGPTSPPCADRTDAGEGQASDNDGNVEVAKDDRKTPPGEILDLATLILETANGEFPELGIRELWIAGNHSAKDNGHWAGYLVADRVCGTEHTHLVRDEVLQAIDRRAQANGYVFVPDVVGPTFRDTLASSGAYRVDLANTSGPPPPNGHGVSEDRGKRE